MYNVIGMWKSKLPYGFSLVELLVSVGILAVLTAGTVSLIGAGPRQRSRDVRRQSDLESIAGALALYRNDLAGYPQCPAGALNCAAGAIPGMVTTYIGAMPADPSSPRQYVYVPRQSGTQCSGSDRCNSFVLCAAGEKPPIVAAAGCPATCGGAFTCSIKVTSQ